MIGDRNSTGCSGHCPTPGCLNTPRRSSSALSYRYMNHGWLVVVLRLTSIYGHIRKGPDLWQCAVGHHYKVAMSAHYHKLVGHGWLVVVLRHSNIYMIISGWVLICDSAQWGSTIKSPWVRTVISWYLSFVCITTPQCKKSTRYQSWYDLTCC